MTTRPASTRTVQRRPNAWTTLSTSPSVHSGSSPAVAAAALGLRVPEDLSVVGFDDIEIASYVGLTTVRQPLLESGRRGAALLLAGLSKGGATASEQLELELVARRTTGAPGR